MTCLIYLSIETNAEKKNTSELILSVICYLWVLRLFLVSYRVTCKCCPYIKVQTIYIRHYFSHNFRRKTLLFFCRLDFVKLSYIMSLLFADIRIPLMWKDVDHFKNKGGN